jgi:hypothetical protein
VVAALLQVRSVTGLPSGAASGLPGNHNLNIDHCENLRSHKMRAAYLCNLKGYRDTEVDGMISFRTSE